MQWAEPSETANGRERFWNQPRITVPTMLFTTAIGALVCSFLGAAIIRICTGGWHWPTSVLISAVIGGIFGLVASFGQRVRVTPQEVELRSHDFSVWGAQEQQMRYDQLRGYSLIQPTVHGIAYRLLMLYPRTGRAFSLGIPPSVPDDQIHAYLRDHVPFVTIIDNEALNVA